MRTIVALLVATLVVLSAASAVAADRFLRPPVESDGVLTFLLLGADQGPYRSGSPTNARADAFHLLFVNTRTRHATFVNVPRDAWVSVPGRGNNRINTCLLNGPERCVQTAERVFGIDVDHWLLTDFRGLDVAVDRFGGVEVDVPRPLTDGGENIGPGRQRLSGAQALTWTRDRKHRPNGDFSRSEAQATLLANAHAQLIRDGVTVSRIAEVAGILRQTALTDINAPQMLRFAYLAMDLPPAHVNNVTLPGRNGMAGRAAVVFLNDSAYTIVDDIAADGVPGAPAGS